MLNTAQAPLSRKVTHSPLLRHVDVQPALLCPSRRTGSAAKSCLLSSALLSPVKHASVPSCRAHVLMLHLPIVVPDILLRL